MKAVAIIQARTGSTRLPGKVLRDMAGAPMLAGVVQRVQRAKTLDDVVVATTTEPSDQPIADLCAERGWPCFRGSQDDVLDRYYQAAKHHQADVVVRITSDCPLIDPGIVDRTVREFLDGQPEIDFASNVWPRRSFPRGLDTEVFRFGVLQRAWQEDKNAAWREHVTPYIYHHPELFHGHGVLGQVDYSGMRWCVDTPEDWELISRIYEHFGDRAFAWDDVLELLGQHPQWLAINQDIQQTVV